jgi:hypothetical protein
MSGDYTRWSFNPTKDFSEVFKQQGRVDLDADWNESAEIVDRRWRTETIDIIGRAIVPTSTKDAFDIKPTGPGQFTIGIGRMYVDGLLAECHGLAPFSYDDSLGELKGKLPVPFNQQPYYPNPTPLPSGAGATDLIYLDVWHREVTIFEDPSIREKALGGPDTTTRVQTVWQVKVLPRVGAHGCADEIPAWEDLIAPSAGRLTTSTVAPAPSPDPCILSATGGYRGLENRLYRVEVHVAGTVGGANPARFKWSRDNASVVSSVDSISAPGGPNSVVKLKSLGRDRVLRFKADDWVELLDDNLELGGVAGYLTKIVGPPDEANRTITVSPPVPAGMFDPTNLERHTRVRRWDQKFTGAGSDVNPTTGLIDVAGGPLDIEDGIQVSFSDDPPGKTLHVGDYWVFAARAADGSVEALQKAPPLGIVHHYARLGFVTWTATGGTFTDCRQFWPPSFGTAEAGCDCTVCLTPEGHNGGTATINKAVTDTIAKGGGKICLSPGLYLIDERVEVNEAAAIQIVGHGLAFLAPGPKLHGGDPLMHIENSIDITVQDLGFIAFERGGPEAQSLPGIVIQNAAFAIVQHCSFLGFPRGTTLAPAIALGGTVLDSVITGNLFSKVELGIGPTAERKQRFLAFLSIVNNQLSCTRGAIELVTPGNAISLEVNIRGNFTQSPVGVALSGIGLDLTVESNAIVIAADDTGSGMGIFSTISQTRIVENEISGTDTSAKSVAILLASLPSTSLYGTQIIGNRISGIGGSGILISEGALLLESIIAQNQLLNLGRGGIVLAGNASAVDLNITDNALAFVAQTPDVSDPNQPFMVGIQLLAALNVNLSGNAIEDLGLDANQTGARMAIFGGMLSGLRISGNRIQNIGPVGVNATSGGVVLSFVLGRVDVADNEIRRALIPPPGGDTADWSAIGIEFCLNDVSVRGNLLQSFGAGEVVSIGTPKFPKLSPSSCIFSENHCFLDNPSTQGGISPAVVEITAQAIIAADNYAKSPSERGTISLNGPFTTTKNTTSGPITILGNVTSGRILVNGAPLPANPWGPLNVMLP